ncbi:MAG TPA: putative 2OG-Fe(II) oxygenase [Gammaproteobacteria bacterium]|nr:putative 2OG-Fe(II) oxygenase [Gammaproteobacteria bacterium]
MSITEETRFEDHFPITVMVSHHTGLEEVNRGIYDVVRTLRDQYINDRNENEALSGDITTYGGYQTSKKTMFLNRPETAIHTLRDKVIAPAVKRYLQHVFAEKARGLLTRTASWANILSAGDWQAPHMHPTQGNLISGVYYVHVPEKPKPQGCIEFLNPHPVARHHGVSLTRRIYPLTGDLILFPPYYIHYVYPFQGAGERAIVAFDVILTSEVVL